MTQEFLSSRLRPVERPAERLTEAPPEKELSAQEQVLTAETGFLKTLIRLAEWLSPTQRAVALSALSAFLLVSRAEAGVGVRASEGEPDIDIPAEVEPTTHITPEMHAMHSLLIELQTAGYTLNFIEGYTATIDINKEGVPLPHPGAVIMLDSLQYYLHKNGGKLFFTSNPVDKLRRSNIIDLELPAEARDTSKPIDMPIYQIAVEQTAEGTTFLVRNWLTGETVYRSENLKPRELIDRATTERYTELIGAAMQKAARKDLAGVQDQWKTVQEQVGPVEVRPSIYAFNEQAEPVENAVEFFAQFESVKFRAQAHNRPHEDINYRTFELDDSIIARTEQHPLEIRNASLQTIELHRQVPLDTDTTPELIVDSYGNVILKSYYHLSHTDESGVTTRQPVELLLIYPQQQFSDQVGPETELHPINLDLTAFGLGTLENYVHQPIERPVFTSENGAYNFYTTMDHVAVREIFGDRLEQAATGVAAVEELYGLPKGSAVRQIMVADSQSPNAYYHFANPEAIGLFDEILQEEIVKLVAAHEAQHRLTRMFGLDNDPELLELHTWFSYQFFTPLNEYNWFSAEYKEHSIPSGHSHDNVSELLSSFHNTLLDPEWQRKIEAATPEFQVSYLQVLLGLQSVLTERIAPSSGRDSEQPIQDPSATTHTISADAPIFRVLQERIDFLHNYGK